MKLTAAISQEIISRAKTVLGRSVVVSDSDGHVIAGDDAATAIDALRACQEGRIIRAEWNDESIAWCPFVYEGRTVGAFGVIEKGVQITPEALGLLQGLAEVITHQHFLLEHMQPAEQVKAEFLKEVLSSPEMDTDEAYRQADILQLNLRAPLTAIMVEVEALEDEGHVSRAITSSFSNPADVICVYLGSGQFLLLVHISGEGLTTRNTTRYLTVSAEAVFKALKKTLPNSVISIGVGQYYPELGGLRKSYQEAGLSLSVGTKVWGTGQVYHIKRVGMFVTLANVAQNRKAELAHQILHPLLRDEQLHKTVQTFLAAGLNLTDAAEQLHVHRNTLIYRLDKTRKLISLDPRRFDDALQIKLGLMFYQET